MPKIKILPHEELCPMGAELDANKGDTVLDVVLKNGAVPLDILERFIDRYIEDTK